MKDQLKKGIGVILILALIGLTAYSALLAAQVSASLRVVTTEERQGNEVITTDAYVDDHGRTVVASDKQYAMVRKTSRNGKVILEEYLDDGGKPVVFTSGYSAIGREYENDLNTRITYLDRDGKPVIISSGYETIRRSYNESRLAEADTYWIGDRQVGRKQGYWRMKRVYGEGDDAWRVIRQEYRGEHDELVINSSGYAFFEQEYNAAGKVSRRMYFDPEGKPAAVDNGSYGYSREYDEQGRTILTTYLDADGQPMNTSKGYASVQTVYTEAGTRTLYFDIEGQSVTTGHRIYGIGVEEGQRTWLNEEGDPLIRLDNLLYDNPMAVIVMGVLSICAALLLKGKMRIAFMVIYGLFILYMTMAWRESGSVDRVQLVLFSSYRKFWTDKSIRQGILNNIWLFVPFGAAVCAQVSSGWGGWKAAAVTVLICGLFSCAIEGIQFATGIGLCEADDVFNNTLGGLIGSAMGTMIRTGRLPVKNKNDGD